MILIPVINKSGSLINIQFISEDGSKRFKKGCQTIGGMSWISPFISKDCDIVVCDTKSYFIKKEIVKTISFFIPVHPIQHKIDSKTLP